MPPSEPLQVVKVVTVDNRVVGTATIRHEDMGVRGGDFAPAPPYAEIRHVFLQFARAAEGSGGFGSDALEDYYRARDALALRVVDSCGDVVPGSVHIVDFEQEFGEIWLEVYPEWTEAPTNAE